MISKTNAVILAISAVVGVGSFLTTRSTNGQAATSAPASVAPQPGWGRMGAMCQWLGLSDEQRQKLQQQDPTFWQEAMDLRSAMATERDNLTKLLRDPAATDQQITDQVEKMIAKGNEMERRVVKHILALRSQLTPEQQSKLLGLCARGVQQRMGWCGMGAGPGRMGPGMGGPGRMGAGRGWGGGFRGGWGQGGGNLQNP